MTGPRATPPATAADHPLRAALARGERAYAQSAPALQHLLAAPDHALIAPAVVAQVRGLVADLARQLAEAMVRGEPSLADEDALIDRLLGETELSAHCQALALEWRLAQRLEAELSIDPVLSPLLQEWIGLAEATLGSLAMAALAAQSRFAQNQRRMQLPLAELPAELFSAAISAAREAIRADAADPRGEARLKATYDESAGRPALLARLAREAASLAPRELTLEDAGVALWLSMLAARSGERRERIAAAAADPHLGRLLLTLRAAGVPSAEAERQALRLQPDAVLPRGLDEVGTREAVHWLAEARA